MPVDAETRTRLPRPITSNPDDVRLAAQEAALRVRGIRGASDQGCSSGSYSVPATIQLSPVQIQAINDSPLDSPKMWMEFAEALFLEPPVIFSNEIDKSHWEETTQHVSLWDS
ncbi:hypothetical protein HHK36_009166 [Tetracentron sinense]|uniref:Uncharacterized protein n=1 Tax=Tetracentron sinense TaxID=13715 RepID=A0A835DLE3_TETSI|nr:hypothetical protein HHK36_009166 [Tetracentron sinense]